MILLDGKATAAAIRRELAESMPEITEKAGRKPGLSVLLVGEDPASSIYVRNKEKACAEAGIASRTFRLPASTPQSELLERIAALNEDKDVDGILLQLPLPTGLDSNLCLEAIAPGKDVDGFHPMNMGRLTLGLPGLRPCTPAGVMTLLSRYGLSPEGKRAVVVGRSNIVGKPLSLMLGAQAKGANATVTICHSRTDGLADICREADFLFAAIGRPRFITKDMVKPGAVVVDVGINRTPEGLCGDCFYPDVCEVASYMTPVPGGVGPMTIAQLLLNTVQAFKAHTAQKH